MTLTKAFADYSGMIMAGAGFLINIFGLPYDVYKIYMHKRVKGNTTPLLWFSVLYTLASLPYSIYYRNYYLLIPESIGAISCVVLFVQIFKYEIVPNKNRRPSK